MIPFEHLTGCSYSEDEKPKTFCDTCGHQFSDVCGTCESLEGVPVKYEDKPPLGIKPRYIHRGERLREILNAMDRYSKASKHIPGEWIDELRDLINSIAGERNEHNFHD